MTDEATMKLIPDVPPDKKPMKMNLDEFPPDALLLSPKPTGEMVESLKEWGQWQPVVASPLDDNGEREVYAGNRRIKAARQLGWEELDGIELIQGEDATVDPRILAEQLNSTIKPNPIVQLEAIELCEEKGVTDPKEIARVLKMKVGKVKARKRLATLHPKLREAVKHNEISFGNADRIAKMSEATQERLAERFVEDGKLPWSVIDEERRKKVDEVTESIELDIGGMPGAEDFDGMTSIADDTPPISDDDAVELLARADRVENGGKVSWSKQDAKSIKALLALLD
jgi:ParB-like chromosome segregation protein Spo0J